MDIENQTFGRKMRGYDPDEVELYLCSVAEEIERLNLEHSRMLEETGRLKKELEELRSRDQTLQKTLVSAQRMSDEMKERAKQEGELLVQEARLRADEILRNAQTKLTRLEMDVTRSNLERDTAERRLRGILEQHLALLDLRQQAHEELDNIRLLSNHAGGS